MEDLIWKFIDNDCNDAEVQKVNHLLSTDVAFKALYDECVQLNDLLVDHAVVSISPVFKSKMVSQIESQLIRSKKTSLEILPTKLVIVLSIMAIASITVAILFTDKTASFMHLDLPIDDKSLSIAIWSMVSFICLVSLDYLLKRTQILKNYMPMFV